MKKKTPKKRAPTDATLRNTRAAKAREAAIEARLTDKIEALEVRIAVLEAAKPPV